MLKIAQLGEWGAQIVTQAVCRELEGGKGSGPGRDEGDITTRHIYLVLSVGPVLAQSLAHSEYSKMFLKPGPAESAYLGP